MISDTDFQPPAEEFSAKQTFTSAQVTTIVVLFSVMVGLGAVSHLFLIAIVMMATLFYILILLFKMLVTAKSITGGLITFCGEEYRVDRNSLPTYSILVPLYKEGRVVSQLVSNLAGIVYPKHKLEVFLLVEADDHETWQQLDQIELPYFIRPITIPVSFPRTKPKACNIGLKFVSGDYCVVYDAEDHPDSWQLIKAVLAFRRVPPEVICIQAKLQCHDYNYSWLSRLFAAEYAFHFNLLLPGLGSFGMPVPLGGTSNHFRTKALKKLDGWDLYNVTEDLDLGMKIARAGLQVQLMDSVTMEEANGRHGSWLRQRSRWIKGYMQTYLVHMRDPSRLYRELQLKNFLAFQLMVGGTIFSLIVNPLFWVMTGIYALTRSAFIESLYPAPVFYAAIFCTVLGNFWFFYSLVLAVMIRGMRGQVKWMFLTPFYWTLMSVAAWKALWQLLVKPHFWERTVHGLDIALSPHSPMMGAHLTVEAAAEEI